MHVYLYIIKGGMLLKKYTVVRYDFYLHLYVYGSVKKGQAKRCHTHLSTVAAVQKLLAHYFFPYYLWDVLLIFFLFDTTIFLRMSL